MKLSKRRLLLALLSLHTVAVVLTTALLGWLACVAPWSDSYFIAALVVSYAMYYFGACAVPATVYCNSNAEWQHRVLNRMGCLRGRGYLPTPYLVNANLQTLYAAMGRPSCGVQYQRERVADVLPDGELLTLDWSMAPSSRQTSSRASSEKPGLVQSPSEVPGTQPNAVNAEVGPSLFATPLVVGEVEGPPGRPPVIILFHGLTGGSDDANMHYLTRWFNEMGWHVVIPIRRGCGELGTITLPKHYAYGDVENTKHVVDYIAGKVEGHPLYGCGISAGSNVLCNYLALVGSRSRIRAAVSVANGYEWDEGTAAIAKHHPVWDLVMSSLVNSTLFHRHATVFGATCEPHKAPHPSTPVGQGIGLPRTSSMREYDEHVSRRLHGFATLKEFYHHQSCLHRLPNIRVPVVLLNALDDPLVHPKLYPVAHVEQNSQLILVTTACGGHLGWSMGWFPFSCVPTWMDRFCVEALAALMSEHARDDPVSHLS